MKTVTSDQLRKLFLDFFQLRARGDSQCLAHP